MSSTPRSAGFSETTTNSRFGDLFAPGSLTLSPTSHQNYDTISNFNSTNWDLLESESQGQQPMAEGEGEGGGLAVPSIAPLSDGNVLANASPMSPPGATLEVLLCADCCRPVASTFEILYEREEKAWKEQVYSYELDLFENGRAVWTYSATNPHRSRFDVIRVAPMLRLNNEMLQNGLRSPDATLSPTASGAPATDVGATPVLAPIAHPSLDTSTVNVRAELQAQTMSLVDLEGPYFVNHSFFVGYDWCSCLCSNCGSFLGWGFAEHSKLEAHRQQMEAGSGSEAEVDALHSSSFTTKESTGFTSASVYPDFLGIIITRCTGAGDYPLARFEQEVRAVEGRRSRRSAMDYISRQFQRDIRNIADGFLAHQLFYRFNEMRNSYLQSAVGITQSNRIFSEAASHHMATHAADSYALDLPEDRTEDIVDGAFNLHMDPSDSTNLTARESYIRNISPPSFWILFDMAQHAAMQQGAQLRQLETISSSDGVLSNHNNQSEDEEHPEGV